MDLTLVLVVDKTGSLDVITQADVVTEAFIFIY